MTSLEPLHYTFTVACSVEHAFETWTAKIDNWWPKDHSISGSSDITVSFETGVGGRLVELSADGTEHTWGRITLWEPPTKLAYIWLIGGPEADGTDVEVTFTPHDGGQCLVEIVHSGWERLEERGPARRTANDHGWSALVASYRAYLD